MSRAIGAYIHRWNMTNSALVNSPVLHSNLNKIENLLTYSLFFLTVMLESSLSSSYTSNELQITFSTCEYPETAL